MEGAIYHTEKWKEVANSHKEETEEEGLTEAEAEVEDGVMKPQEGEITMKYGLKEEEMEVF